MRMRNTVLISIIAFCLAGVAAIAAFGMIRNAPFVGFTDATMMLHELGTYKDWTKVTSAREPMAMAAALLCAMPLPGSRKGPAPGAQSLEDTAFISVYVNPVGRHAMMSQAKPRFPVGSIIVREKFRIRGSHQPELLTVMMKREPGYDPARGDWEYMVVNGGVSEIRARGALASCGGCHQQREADDYIFRSYLPEDVVRALE